MTEKKIMALTVGEFAAMVDMPESALSPAVLRMIAKNDFTYTPLVGDERDHVLLDALRQLGSSLKVAGPHRKADWEKGWTENLREFREEKDTGSLKPKYFGPDQVLRLHRQYVRAVKPGFIQRFHSVYCRIIFEQYLSGADCIREFGCGTGQNLIALAELYPDKKVVGLDWAQAAVELVNELGSRYKNLCGKVFDMFHPDSTIVFGPNDGVLTVHSLEQLGPDHGLFLDFIMQRHPGICVHIEPVSELYDNDNLLDYLAHRYHQKRGYLENFLTTLRDIETQGRAEILKIRRSYFGSTFDEGYSLIVWRPR